MLLPDVPTTDQTGTSAEIDAVTLAAQRDLIRSLKRRLKASHVRSEEHEAFLRRLLANLQDLTTARSGLRREIEAKLERQDA